uniref:Uncharacterized protein n=1 Tax=Chromera velia CCMP2878 TaxID=1169474 RepID=A0A0G4I446_9ALVE|eukprot:Cvel_10766.t1-p1 / transcript=Cvel_10766.t1 / gene=Cvel_10766 / organism=Chromera_velia_CCMP2878 / gene_product=hypothetical protein / transcript_product=hypothetical protein / location=Cvel_scaffold657:49647-50204(+) / protein_length=186 / sequence_SO=supercontig / SO=protein_coding / is_pseudo=false
MGSRPSKAERAASAAGGVTGMAAGGVSGYFTTGGQPVAALTGAGAGATVGTAAGAMTGKYVDAKLKEQRWSDEARVSAAVVAGGCAGAVAGGAAGVVGGGAVAAVGAISGTAMAVSTTAYNSPGRTKSARDKGPVRISQVAVTQSKRNVSQKSPQKSKKNSQGGCCPMWGKPKNKRADSNWSLWGG